MSIIARTVHQIRNAWEYLKGSDQTFSLQHRIYHSICIATMLVIFYNIPFSLIVGLYKMTILSTILFLLQLFFYYLSRFKNHLYTSMVIYSVIIHIFFAINFYLSSGIQGTALHSFTISYFLIIAIAKRQHYWYWTLGNLVVVGALIVYEYYHPELIFNRYGSRRSQFIDVASTYTVDLLLIFGGLTYIINNYDREKKIARENEMAMKRLSQEKSKLISMISHDFRTPLRNVQGYLDILKRTDLESNERARLEVELEKSTTETQHLLDNLLSWTTKHLEDGKIELLSVNLTDCLKDQLSNFARAANFKLVNFENKLPKEINVRVNPAMLQLMVRNLMDNALKFTSSGGNITLSAELSADVCQLHIRDSGAGIAEEAQQDIFSLNIKSSFGTEGEKGVGLGLALCKEFADLQGVDMSFQSRVGKGTIFTLAIPMG
ncbi:MAG: HAMP domain-containing sensor histidine kinase [Pedobacter sp.]|uniref:sensor histidine kinase n=1 Tax=Pedobacter sp. TaxID=1411316 RepID=UPI002807F95D|nr:HAMP domain-containing sensor histidine kinase [Pedobacter sp.]MDQ8004101.1 HAMP domain-containing sensor histidine kinase [Pedobacter sp.]